MNYALLMIALSFALLTGNEAKANPAVCWQYNAVLHAPDSVHEIGADALITVRLADWDREAGYTYEHTDIGGAFAVSCDTAFKPSSKTACGLVVDSVDQGQPCEAS